MRRIVAVAVLLAALGAPAGAAAAVTGDFGGGALRTLGSPLGGGNMVIGLSSADGSTVQVSATVVAGCASGTFTATAPVAADGTFSAFGTVRQASVRTSYALRGTLTELPAGTLTARFERGDRRCSAMGVQWEARRAATTVGVPANVGPYATLRGPTEQRHGGAPRGIVLRIAADGGRISRALYGVTMRCSDGSTSPTFDLPRDRLEILADGRVSDREDATRRTRATITRYIERFAATLGSEGAEGMFSAELSVRDRRTGKRRIRCRSGIVRWSASY